MRFFLLLMLFLILLGCESAPTEAKREWSAFRKVRAGMSREQVYALAGPSQHTEPCRNGIMRGFVVESWVGISIVEAYRDAPAKMEVTFDERGIALSVHKEPYRPAMRFIKPGPGTAIIGLQPPARL